MPDPKDAIRRPHPLDSLREFGAGLEMMRGLARSAASAILPRAAANGVRVIVLPGFGADDYSTLILRRHLGTQGFKPEGWSLGRNKGDVRSLLPRFVTRLERRVAAFGQPVALVGWSLGGYIAREAARERPELVTQVITLGSPVKGGPKYTVFAPYYRARGLDLDRIEERIAGRETRPLSVPVTAFYSRHDGVVGWRACLSHHEPMVKHIEVDATHCGMGFAPHMLEKVAKVLAGG